MSFAGGQPWGCVWRYHLMVPILLLASIGVGFDPTSHWLNVNLICHVVVRWLEERASAPLHTADSGNSNLLTCMQHCADASIAAIKHKGFLITNTWTQVFSGCHMQSVLHQLLWVISVMWCHTHSDMIWCGSKPDCITSYRRTWQLFKVACLLLEESMRHTQQKFSPILITKTFVAV